MILPSNIRQKASELFSGDAESQRKFCMGAAFALGMELTDFEEETPPQDDYPLQEALEVWLAYKKEKKQTYKPIGLKALKKKLFTMSGGNPAFAKEIVEFSMANNYSGLFVPNNSSHGRQQSTFSKIGAILNG